MRDIAGLWATAASGVRVVARGSVRIAVWGDCGASDDELRAGLAYAAARRWVELTRWPGSYWVVADDGTGTRFVAGDLSGFRGVFHTVHRGQVLWSTRVTALTEVTGAAPSLGLIAARAVCGGELCPHQSAWTGVRVVPGGYGLLIEPGGHRLVDVTGLGAPASFASGARALGAALTDEVQRLARHGGEFGISADASGGLDSSTVDILAARVAPLLVTTWAGSLASAEDTRFAHQVVEHLCQIAPGRRIVHQVADTGGHFDVLTLPAPTDAPVLSAATWGMDSAYLAPAAGRAWHLTGHGGDVVLDADPSAVWVDLLRSGRRGEARRQVAAHARLRDSAPGALWKRIKTAARDDRSTALYRAADALAHHQPTVGVGWPWVQIGTESGWLTDKGRDETARCLYETADCDGPQDASTWDDWGVLRAVGTCARDEAPLYAALGLRTAHPFLHNAVVRAAFAVPATVRHRPGQYKPLLGAALPDLPAWLTGRRSKGSFGATMLTAIRTRRDVLAELVSTSPLITGGYLERAAVLGALGDLATGRSSTALAAFHHVAVAAMWSTNLAAIKEAAC